MTFIGAQKSATTRPIDPDSEIDIQTQVMNLLASIIPHPSETPQLTVKPEREQYGTLEQLLITPSSRQLYETLLKAPTEAQALNWKRSKTRQAYFKALDIPLDLEAESSAMAAAQQRRLSEQQHNMASPRASTHNLRTPVPTRPGTPASAIHTGISASRSAPVSRVSSPALPPVLDRSAAQKLINLSPEELQQEPTEKLRQIQTELESLIKVASAQLTHTMDQQEKLTGDADTYDRMIQVCFPCIPILFLSPAPHVFVEQDLVSTAQKLKPAANNRVSMSSAKQSSDLKRADSLPKKSSSLWSRSRASSPGGQQASQLRQGSMH